MTVKRVVILLQQPDASHRPLETAGSGARLAAAIIEIGWTIDTCADAHIMRAKEIDPLPV
jgi:hypothetical protein